MPWHDPSTTAAIQAAAHHQGILWLRVYCGFGLAGLTAALCWLAVTVRDYLRARARYRKGCDTRWGGA